MQQEKVPSEAVAQQSVRRDGPGDDGVAEIVLDVPDKLNALDREALAEVGAAVEEAIADGARALVLRGEGRAFCAGRDISRVDPVTDDVDGYLADTFTSVARAIADASIPSFAAVQGACLGVGLGLAAACDVVYVAEDAKLGSPFAKLGAALDSGGHWLFLERLGPHRALDLIVTGELISGDEAVRSGLFSRAVPAAELLPLVRSRAAMAAGGALDAIAGSKRLIGRIRSERLGYWDALAAENALQAELARTDDYIEGFRAFQEKRSPRFGASPEEPRPAG